MPPPTKKARKSVDSTVLLTIIPREFRSNGSWSKVIKSFLSKDTENLSQIIQGEHVTSLLYPLIYETAEKENQKVFYRSLSFFRSFVEESESSRSDFKSFSAEIRNIICVGLRDLYFASLLGLLLIEENNLVIKLANLVDDSDSFIVSGLSVSFYPSKNRKLLKYMDIPLEFLEATNSSDLFIQPAKSSDSSDSTSLRAVFVDPRDLSYHNFETIIRLDSWFKSQSPFHYSPSTPHRIDPKYEIFSFNLTPSAGSNSQVDCLHLLDSLDLYTPPLNASTRGGNRYIFQSTELSNHLSETIRSSGVLTHMSPSNLSGDKSSKYSAENTFISVNSVFRLNKFSPQDKIFESHLDTPYSDPTHHHYSRYSILIYLSSGSNENTLSFDENKIHIDEISDLMCVIFRQDYEHAGRPFIDSEKIFLRSELIFHIEDDSTIRIPTDSHEIQKKTISNNSNGNGVSGIRYDDQIGRLFTSAVYFTGQSIFQPELSLHAHHCYELSNRMHWNCQTSNLSLVSESNESRLLSKVFSTKNDEEEEEAHQFITCGSDYWFQRELSSESNRNIRQSHQVGRKKVDENELYLKECVATVVLDYFNCIVMETPFRSLCETSVLTPPLAISNSVDYQDFIWSRFSSSSDSKPSSDSFRVGWKTGNELAKESLKSQKPPPKPNSKYCCPFHSYPEDETKDPNREAAKVPELNEYVHSCRSYAELKFRNSNLLFNWLGKDLILNDDSFLIEGDRVYVLNTAGSDSRRLNFAACWNGGGMDSYVSAVEDGGVSVKRLLIPPLMFHSSIVDGKQRVHLMVDFFQNNWCVTVADRVIPIPEIRYNGEDGTGCYRHEVHQNFFLVNWDESRETYSGPASRVDLDGDTFISPDYSSDNEEREEEDDGDETY